MSICRSRLKAKNLMYIKQLLHILSSFIKVMEGEDIHTKLTKSWNQARVEYVLLQKQESNRHSFSN